MRGEEVGGHDSLSGEYGLIMLTVKIWTPLGNEKSQRQMGAACRAMCTHSMELEFHVKFYGEGPGRSRLQIQSNRILRSAWDRHGV